MGFITELENSCSVALGTVVVYGYCVGKLAKAICCSQRDAISVKCPNIYSTLSLFLRIKCFDKTRKRYNTTPKRGNWMHDSPKNLKQNPQHEL